MDLINEEDGEQDEPNNEESEQSSRVGLQYDSEFSELYDLVNDSDFTEDEVEHIFGDMLEECGSLFLSFYNSLMKAGFIDKHIEMDYDKILEFFEFD